MNDIDIRVSNIDDVFKNLSPDAIKKLLNYGIYGAVDAIKDKAKQNLPQAAFTENNAKKWKRPMVQGIYPNMFKEQTRGKVSIMGDARLRWLEGGTQERSYIKDVNNVTSKGYFTRTEQKYLKSKGVIGHKTGFITATNFFSKAISIANIDEVMVSRIEEKFNKIK